MTASAIQLLISIEGDLVIPGSSQVGCSRCSEAINADREASYIVEDTAALSGVEPGARDKAEHRAKNTMFSALSVSDSKGME